MPPLLNSLASAWRAVSDSANSFVEVFSRPLPPFAPPPPPAQTVAERVDAALRLYTGPAPIGALRAAYEVACAGAEIGTANGGLGVRGAMTPPERVRLYDAGFTRVIGDGVEEWLWLGPDV